VLEGRKGTGKREKVVRVEEGCGRKGDVIALVLDKKREERSVKVRERDGERDCLFLPLGL